MDKLTQLQKNLDEFNQKFRSKMSFSDDEIEKLQYDFYDNIKEPFTELLKELGLNDKEQLPITLDKEEDESKPA